ncbi:MAG TPA: aminotransferase class IV [Microthrixaceae bacterium]|nr:aminotransferase class IV [Microthrixaceae bacterium]
MTMYPLGPVHRPHLGTVFETVEVLHGRPFALQEHLDLLHVAAARLGVGPPDRHMVESAVKDTAEAWGQSPGRLRVAWSGSLAGHAHDGSLLINITSLTVPEQAARVEVAEHAIDTGSDLCGLKSSGLAATVARLAAHPEADEVLVLDSSGELVEGCSSNVFVVLGDSLVAPPLSSGCRAGVTRSVLLRAARSAGIPVREEAIPMLDARAFRTDTSAAIREAFLTSTGRHVQAISSISGQPLDPDGELTRAAREAFLAARD